MSSLFRSRRITLSLAVCTGLAWATSFLQPDRQDNMHVMPNNLVAFSAKDPIPSCAQWRDFMPAKRDPDVYRIYIDARKRWRSKRPWEFSRNELAAVLADVQTAASRGDWGAKALLAHFYHYGLGPLDSNNVLPKDVGKAVEIAREAAKNGQPWGFYDLGVAHEYGYGGAVLDNAIAWAYYLKAAKLGSPDAQMTLAGAYRSAGNLDGERAMVKCAGDQGHGAAIHSLALDAAIEGRAEAALRLFQDGVKYGSKECAAALQLKFGSHKDLGQAFLPEIPVDFDPERERRYGEIADALDVNPDLKFGRLDELLPLPPAVLPAWRGVDAALTPEPKGPPTY